MRGLFCIFLITLLSPPTPCTSSSSSTTSPPNPYQYHPQNQKPTLSLHSSSLSQYLQTKWSNARDLALLEQTVEDYNAEIVATAPDVVSSISRRRLIVLPLDERFDPPMGVFSHGHVQTGDKMSLPRVFWDAIVKGRAEVPWLFEVSRIPSITSPLSPSLLSSTTNTIPSPPLTRVVGGAIDFRSPSNYIFLPRWMILAMALKPLDVVDVRLTTTTPPGSAVRLRPHSSEFLKIGNHRAVLETELKHYSALTKGATIPFDYNDKRYFFDVVDLRSAPRGEAVALAKVQDCDIAAEFVRAKDRVKKKRRVEKDDDSLGD